MKTQCSVCGFSDGHAVWCGDRPDKLASNDPLNPVQAPPQPPQPIPAAAVVQTDGSVYYAVLGAMTWDTFMFELITKGCVMTRDIFINRPSIARVQYVMLPPQPDVGDGSNVVSFPPTKGSA